MAIEKLGLMINGNFVESVPNSDKVNGLEIMQDESGVLKIGDTIIPQKKLIWSGSVALRLNQTHTITSSMKFPTFENGKTYELKFSDNTSLKAVYSQSTGLQGSLVRDVGSNDDLTSGSIDEVYIHMYANATKIQMIKLRVNIGSSEFTLVKQASTDAGINTLTSIYEIIE